MATEKDSQILTGTVEPELTWPIRVLNNAGQVIARIDHRGLIYSDEPGVVSDISVDNEDLEAKKAEAP